jgi:hypothetical protein
MMIVMRLDDYRLIKIMMTVWVLMVIGPGGGG